MQSISQLSDRYEKKEWEELIGNADIQICLGCNDQMTAVDISAKWGMATIRVNNSQMPLMPLSPPSTPAPEQFAEETPQPQKPDTYDYDILLPQEADGGEPGMVEKTLGELRGDHEPD